MTTPGGRRREGLQSATGGCNDSSTQGTERSMTHDTGYTAAHDTGQTADLPADPAADLARRIGPVLRPDPARVLLRPFVPGQELVTLGVSRADAVVSRVLALDDATVDRTLADVTSGFDAPHGGLSAVFEQHVNLLPPKVDGVEQLTGPRAELAGAYLTQQYAIEAAAILNPSLVEHPDQSGLTAGELRFVMTLRGVGEGHISSLEFRTGVLAADRSVRLDEPGTRLTRGVISGARMAVDHLRAAMEDLWMSNTVDPLLQALPDPFTPRQLEDTLRRSELLLGTRRSAEETPLDRMRRVAQSCYRLDFDPASLLSERVVFPWSDAERGGIEDVRMVRFVDDDGQVTYRATYTAYDGANIAPHLLRTEDFLTFHVDKLAGPAAQDKGMALFPRPIGGRQWSLARWDRENISLAESADGLRWERRAQLLRPRRPWELIQLGTCASPLETPAGWLVVTHGVGPVRRYSLGAMLLDLDEPNRVLGDLDGPLLTPNEEERVGYVPNVVYTCGALIHEGTLVLPYGCSDSSIRFATFAVDDLVSRMSPGGKRSPSSG